MDLFDEMDVGDQCESLQDILKIYIMQIGVRLKSVTFLTTAIGKALEW